MQLQSKTMSCKIGNAAVGEGASIPINATLRISVQMSTDQFQLFKSLMGAEELDNVAAIFIEKTFEQLQTKK